jgi:L-ascorbate metabolism protein UlaG (beta-lactamase superfamily)
MGRSGRLGLSFLAVLALITLLGGDLVAQHKLVHPALEPCKSLAAGSAAAQGAKKLRVTFMGVTTLLLDDGETAIMTDGFFSRPGKTSLLRKIKPNQTRINYALSRAGVSKLAAVLTAHSHHDHAMDSPEVARRTGALLIGSESTRNIAGGADFPDDRFRVIRGGETFTFGCFKITVIKSLHSPSGRFVGKITKGEITTPLRPPVRVWKYKEGGSYSFLIEHDGRRLLIHASANYSPDFLRDVRADLIFLGIGRLGKQSDKFAQEYWREVVQATRAKVIIPIHWDDITRPLDKPLRPTSRPLDNIDRGMKTVLRLAEANHVTVRHLSLFESIDISELSR